MLGVLRQQERRHDEALDLIGRALALMPANHVFHNNYGAVLHALGRHQEAAAEFAQVLALSPNYADALANQGMAMMSLGHDTAALASLGRALQLQPAHGDALRRAAALLKKYGRAGEAVPLFERAIALAASDNGRSGVKPLGKSGGTPLLHPARLHVDFGELLVGLSSRDRAIEQYRRALELSPDLAEAHVDLGAALSRKARSRRRRATRRAVELRPDSAAMHSNWVYCQQYRAGVTPEALAAAHAEWDRRHGMPLRSTWRGQEALTPGPSPGRRGELIRLGFVSRHFRQHPVGCMTVRAIECLKELRTKLGPTRRLPGPLPEGEGDRHVERDEYFARISAERDEYVRAKQDSSRPFPEGEGNLNCEVYCYSDTPRRDAITERFVAAADCWRDTDKLSDDALAEQIRRDRIDILFDLGGHLGHNRLLLFARKPAPIQVKWVGYPGSSGLTAMDYLLADRYHVPPGDERYCPEKDYPEKVLRLPDGYICFDPPAEAPEVGPLPALARGHVTFGSVNNPAKITPGVAAAWAEILRRVPGSRLRLRFAGFDEAGTRGWYQGLFAAAGIAAERIDFLGWAPAQRCWLTTTVSIWPWTRFPTPAESRPARRYGWACR